MSCNDEQSRIDAVDDEFRATLSQWGYVEASDGSWTWSKTGPHIRGSHTDSLIFQNGRRLLRKHGYMEGGDSVWRTPEGAKLKMDADEWRLEQARVLMRERGYIERSDGTFAKPGYDGETGEDDDEVGGGREQ